MVRNWRWYAGLHVLLALGSLTEELLHFKDARRRISSSAWTLGMTLQLAHGCGALALGVIFDRTGPVACLFAANLSYLVFEASGPSGFHQAGHVAHAMAHPTIVPWALAIRECAAEDRAGVVAHVYLSVSLVARLFSAWSMQILFYGGKLLVYGLPLLSLAFGLYLNRWVQDHDSGPTSPTRAESAVLLPRPLAALPRCIHESLWRILSRPAVHTAFLLLAALGFVRDVQGVALGLAASDVAEAHFGRESLARSSRLRDFAACLSWACLPALYVGRFGPRSAIQTLLGALAAVLAADTVLYLVPLPPGLNPARQLLLHVSLLPLGMARDLAEVVCVVFLVGIVGRSERGTLASLKSFFGIHGSVPLPLHRVAELLYRRGGLPAVLGLNSAVALATLLLFRRSALMHARLKDE